MSDPARVFAPVLITCALAGRAAGAPADGWEQAVSPAASLAVSPAAAPHSEDHAELLRVLNAMRNAVLAGDGEAYLAHVDLTDPNFATEQRMWAGDLARHRPSAFSLEIVPARPEHSHEPGASADARIERTLPHEPHSQPEPKPEIDPEGGVASCELLMTWTMPGLAKDGADLTRSARFPARFTRDQNGDWKFAGEHWLVRESKPGTTGERAARALYFDGFEEAADRVVALLPEVRAHVHAGFETRVDHVQEVKIYPSMTHLQGSIYLSYADALSGWNEPGESIKLLLTPKTGESRLRVLLAHEYAHVVNFRMGPRATDSPWWVLEGVAELATEAFTDGTRSLNERVESWAKAGQLARWEDLTDFRSVPANLHRNVYKQGQHMLGYISTGFGRTRRNDWLRAMAEGHSIDEATRRTLGLGFAELDERWRSDLNKPEPVEPVPVEPDPNTTE